MANPAVSAWFDPTDSLTDSERAMLMGGAVGEIYGWSPSAE